MDVPGRVELGHKEGVPVPELGLDEAAVEFLEAEGGELVLDALEEFDIGIAAPGMSLAVGLLML